MNNENLHKIFNSTDCISTEKMVDYQEGKLSELEKNSVEKHLSSCNMCRDEFEGLLLIPVKASLPVTIFELNTKVDNILANTYKKIPFLMPINLMAAIILFVIGFAWYATYYIHSVTQLKKVQVSQSLYISKDRGEIIIIRPEPSLTENDDKFTTRYHDRIENKSEFKLEENKTDEIIDNSLSNVKILDEREIADSENKKEENISNGVSSGNAIVESAKSNDDKNISITEDVSLASNEKDIAVDNEDLHNKNKKNELSRSKKGANSSNNILPDNFDIAKGKYDNHDYITAIELFKQSLSQHQPKDEVYYYLAMSYENINAYADALSNFNKVISNKQSTLVEKALWSKSLILLKLDKQKSAINSLNQIKKMKGKYSKLAERKLDSLNIK